MWPARLGAPRHPRARALAPALAVLLLAGALVGCSGDDGKELHTIAILRAVAGSEREQQLTNVLAEEGYGSDRLRVLGGSSDETHATPEDAERTVRGWVADGAELILALSTSGAQAAARAAPKVPVLFLSNDPKASGLLRNERHPEGHLTGVTYRVPSDRILTEAGEALGQLRHVGCLYPRSDPAAIPTHADLVRGAKALGIRLSCVAFEGPAEVPAAVQEVAAKGVDAIVLVSAPSTSRAYPELERALAGVRIPVVAGTPTEFAVVTLQPDASDLYRQMGRQAARLLDGTPVVDVPVEDPGHFLLVISLPAARRVGRTIPAAVLKRADTVVP